MKTPIAALLFSLAVCAFAHATVTPSQGTPIGLEGEPSFAAQSRTDKKGAFAFSGLAPGNYKLSLDYAKLTKQLAKSDKDFAENPDDYKIELTVQSENSDGIFDRWGNLLTVAPTPILITPKNALIGLLLPAVQQSAMSGGGAGSGKVIFNDLKVTGTLTYSELVMPAIHLKGKSTITTKLTKYTLRGTVRGDATRLTVRKSGGKPPLEFLPTARPNSGTWPFVIVLDLKRGENEFTLQASGSGGKSRKVPCIVTLVK